MSNPRVVLISSPVKPSSANSQLDRSSQIIDAIRQSLNAIWVGWSATGSDAAPRGSGNNESLQVRVLSRAQTTALSAQLNSQIMWPAFYGRADLINFDSAAYDLYQNVNSQLAADLATWLVDGDVVWVHDYLHVPIGHALRREGVAVPVGFLCHAPFPAPDQITNLPRHEEVLRQLCAYDLAGFQSEDCRRHFEVAAQRVIGAQRTPDGLVGPFGNVMTRVQELPGRSRDIVKRAQSDIGRASAAHLRESTAGQSLIASFASLDQTQAIIERLRSFEMLLTEAPEWRRRTSLVQATLPQRGWLPEDTQLRIDVERAFTSINGEFATFGWTPIHYFHEPLDTVRLIALCRDSAVGLFTPFSEGVSLTAKDFVAAQQSDNPGVLIMSNLISGAARRDGALLVNPHDKAETAHAIRLALSMPRAERYVRWRKLMDLLDKEDLVGWCHDVIAEVLDARAANSSRALS
jgi:trehalose 6-phosphate synthase